MSAAIDKENMPSGKNGTGGPAPSTLSSFSTKLVADSKKFNAVRIRRRMMEQQQRFSTKTAMNQPLKTREEDKKMLSGQSPAKKNHPTLAIAVSMSEDAGEDNYNNRNGYQANSPNEEDDTTVGNASAWAMIEHYSHGLNKSNNGIDKMEAGKVVPLWNNQGKEPSNEADSFSISPSVSGDSSDSSRGTATSANVSANEIFVNHSPGKIKLGNRNQNRIEWYEDADGELVQNSVCTDTSYNKYGIHRSPAVQDQIDNDANASCITEEEVGIDSGIEHTPPRWEQEEDCLSDLHEDEKKDMEDDDSSPPTSLLQDSVLFSGYAPSAISKEGASEASVLGELGELRENSTEESYDENYSVNASYTSRAVNATQISMASLEQSDAGTLRGGNDVSRYTTTSELEAINERKATSNTNDIKERLKSSSPDRVDKDSVAAMALIEELEQNLKVQGHKANVNEMKLKDRVRELEQALRTTVTTPRGSIMQENPLKALLDRNQTLVKEVRFADQTCIELSSKMSALEAKNQILEEQTSQLQHENDSLNKELEKAKKNHKVALDEKQQKIDELLEKLKTFGIKEQKSHDHEKQQSNIQEAELNQLRNDLEDAKALVDAMEKNWEHQRKNYTQKIQSLEEQLRQATDHMYLYQDGPTSPRLINADKRVFELEKELAHSRASVQAMRLQFERYATSGDNLSKSPLTPDGNQNIISMVHSSMSKILSQYRRMESRVNEAIDMYSDRLENLSATVSCLRSSLVFETDSVSTHVRDEKGVDAMMDASNFSHHTDDEMFQLMEEARSPMSFKSRETEDQSSVVDDFSRLVSDDFTLGSITKLESVGASFSFSDRWKEPLEIAIKECKRVKDKAIELKKEVEQRKNEIQKLEIENGKLSLQATRQAEENKLVETALEEAQQRIEKLESKLDSSEEDIAVARRTVEELEEKIEILQKEKSTMENELQTSNQNLQIVEKRVEQLSAELKGAKENLQALTASCETYKQQNEELKLECVALEKRMIQEKEDEVALFEKALRTAKDEVEQLKESRDEVVSNLATESKAKENLETIVVQLQAAQQQILSDAEDRLLEERFRQEDSRIQRADLKSKLTRKEKELSSLQESYSSYQKRAEQEVQRRDSSLRSLKTDLSSLVSNCRKLSVAREDLCNLMESCGLNSDWVRLLKSARINVSTGNEAAIRAGEISLWVDAMPNIGRTIKALIGTQEVANQLQSKVDLLNENVIRLHEAEDEYKSQIKDESEQNKKLLSLLHQAEQEMERSAKQIRDLSSALSRMQQQEAEAIDKAAATQNKLHELEQNYTHELGQMKQERDEAVTKVAEIAGILQEKESCLSSLHDQLDTARSQIAYSEEQIQTKTEEGSKLESKINSLEVKCSRLRDFIKKLTAKCDEWEASYEKQSRAMEKLQVKDARTRERAEEIANRYKKLVSSLKKRTQHHKDDRAKWSAERSNLHQVHTKLEEELEIIARELSTIDPTGTC